MAKAKAKAKAQPIGNDQEAIPRFRYGDRVKIRLSGGQQGRVVELRGPLGPGGAQIYRIRIRRKSGPVYVEVREDQLIALPPRSSAKP